MEGDVLSIDRGVVFDESIAHCEVHAHQPYASSTFNNSDEIRIAVQHQDLCLLPSQSSLHVHGRLVKIDGTTPVTRTTLVNNAICHLFDEIRYELNAIEIDRNKNVGLTTLMKGYVSHSPNQIAALDNAGWLGANEVQQLTDDQGYFDVSIPLAMILGFAEDYHKIVANAKHELILVRSRSDNNAVLQSAPIRINENDLLAQPEEFKIVLNKVEWRVPYVMPSDQYKIKLLNFIGKDKPISMSFRTWEMYEYPLLPNTSKNVWPVKTSSQLEKPRYVILGFQTKRKNNIGMNASHFDHCKISNVKLFLNSQYYPYGDLNLNIDQNQYALLYDMYTEFQKSYYNKQVAEPLLTKREFLQYAPLIVIDCSKQNEALKSAPVDIRLEFETRENIPAETSAYCIILHDRVIQYNPISGGVKKLI